MKPHQSILGACLVGAFGLVLAMSATPQSSAPESNSAGTYFLETVTQSTGQAINGFVSLHKDGTVTWADQSDFGAAGFFNSTTHGVWRKTGPDEATIVGYYYRFDASGAPLVLVRITSVGSLTGGQGVGTVDVFGPNQNPAIEPPIIPNADFLTISTYRLD